MFRNAIVRRPCPEIIHGLTTASLGKPDFRKALKQHEAYIEALKTCGLDVHILEGNSSFPDSVFIEDIALCTPHCAIVTNPGAVSRRGETFGIETVLGRFFQSVEKIELPGTLEAGDVMMTGNHYFIGNSGRTNDEGANQLISILESYGMTGEKVPLYEMLHLKSGVSYLENDTLLVTGEFSGHKTFKSFNRIHVDDHEAYAANSLWINGTVLVPDGFPETEKKIRIAGYDTIIVDVSEYQKLDGGLSCLSLRF